jgi:response regulator NasT
MRVAIVKSNGHLDNRISRVLANNGINGDIITKFTRNTLNEYDTVVFTHQNSVPNMPKLLERIVLEKKIHVIYITNTPSIGQFYNLFDDIYFNYVQEHKIDLVLSTIIKHTKKYLKEISYLESKRLQVEEELDLLKSTNKAKRILIKKGLSEEDSHKFIVSKAMEMRVSKKKLVNLIIEEKIDI